MRSCYSPIRGAFLAALLLCCAAVYGQDLKSGFDADEYIHVLHRCAMQVDSSYRGHTPADTMYTRVYRSPVLGLHNRYDLWLRKDHKQIAIDLRGTTSNIDSWLENLYSAMVPASGSFDFGGAPFTYKFAADSRAMVHVGWALGVCSMLPDITAAIKLWYSRGVRQILIEGHSQGGALAFLLCSWLRYQVADGKLPDDLVIKTYCSAAPKPGNLYYAYDFDYINRGGWAFTVVNAKDWVPETPITVQTKNDLNDNPFGNTRQLLKKQKLLVRYYIRHMYRSMEKASLKAQRKYEKYLGRVMYKQVRKYMKDLGKPAYAHSCNYMPAGTQIVLEPDSTYYKMFPDTGDNIFRHHLFDPYYYLVKKAYK